MHVKRWLILLLIGIVLISLGLAYLLRYLYADLNFPHVFYYLTLQFLSRSLRAVILGGLGIGLTTVALIGLNCSLRPFVAAGQENVAERVYQHHRRRRGPKIVALGGGTGR